MVVNILHLTDFHYTLKRRHDQKIVFDALIKKLQLDSDTYLKPDLIVLSGDIVFAADEEDGYGHFLDNILQPILLATKCGSSRVVMTPGNHDIPRKFVDSDKARHRGLRLELTDRDKLNEEFLEGRLDDFVNNKFRNYRCLDELVGSKPVHKNCICAAHTYPELGISILEMNSAWMGNSGIKEMEKDLRQLLIPEAAVSDNLEKLKLNDYLILVSHHPLDWLTEFGQRDVVNVIGDRLNMHLYGHMHDPQPALNNSLKGQCFSNQGGATYTHRDYYNGYSIIRVDTETKYVEVHLRSYYEKRREFDDAVDVVKNGIFHPTAESAKFFHRIAKKVDRAKLKIWCDSVLKTYLKKEFSEGLVDKPLNELFVPPQLIKEIEIINGSSDTPERVEHDVSFQEIVSSKRNQIIYGKSEYGKTTLLQQIALETLEVAKGEFEQKAPVLINFQYIKKGKDRIEALIRGALPETPDDCSIKDLLTEGLLTVLIDDVNFRDSDRYSELREFMGSYPKNRYIISSLRNSDGNYQSIVDTKVAISFEHMFMKPMRRKDMRELVENWDSDGQMDREAVLNRVLNDIANINIPVTAVNGTILLSIFESHANFTPINRSVLIERFVEVLLEKRSKNQAARETFDFRNRTHFLSALAVHMTINNSYVLSEGKVISFTESYLGALGIKHDASKLIRELTNARIILKRNDGCISFRYRAFLEYFIASRMHEDSEFRAWVLDETRYFSFVNEIQYYAGIGRDDKALLEMLGNRFAALSASTFKNSEINVDLASIDNVSLPQKDDTSEKILDTIEKEVHGPRMTDEERDEILEGELPIDVEGRQEVFRPAPKDEGSLWFTVLIIYSNVLRNLELIPDPIKRRHLRKLLEAWGSFLQISLWNIPNLAEQKHAIVNGLRYHVQVPSHFTTGQTARFLFLEIPNAVGKIVYGALGTPKLQSQISTPTELEDNEENVLKYFRALLGIDLRIPGWIDSTSRFIADVRGNRYFTESIIWKLSETHALQPLDENHTKQLRNVIATSIADMRGGTKEDRSKQRSRNIETFRRRDLIRRLKVKKENE